MGKGRMKPNGDIARTDDDYFGSWEDVAKKLFDYYGLECYGFAPGFGISGFNGECIGSFTMPCSVAIGLIEVYENKLGNK